MQCLPSEAGNGLAQPGAAALDAGFVFGINGVARQRMVDMRQMHPDLMGAARLQP